MMCSFGCSGFCTNAFHTCGVCEELEGHKQECPHYRPPVVLQVDEAGLNAMMDVLGYSTGFAECNEDEAEEVTYALQKILTALGPQVQALAKRRR